MLGVEVEIIRHYATLLTLITTAGVEIDPDEWEKFCNEHLDKYYYNNGKYSWAIHTPTVCIHILYIFTINSPNSPVSHFLFVLHLSSMKIGEIVVI